MIQKYFYSITVKRKSLASDGLGGHVTSYVSLGTVKGILAQTQWSSRFKAEQSTPTNEYVFMTDSSQNSIDIAVGDIVTGGGHTAILTSLALIGEQMSVMMRNIVQFKGEPYKEGVS